MKIIENFVKYYVNIQLLILNSTICSNFKKINFKYLIKFILLNLF